MASVISESREITIEDMIKSVRVAPIQIALIDLTLIVSRLLLTDNINLSNRVGRDRGSRLS